VSCARGRGQTARSDSSTGCRSTAPRTHRRGYRLSGVADPLRGWRVFGQRAAGGSAGLRPDRSRRSTGCAGGTGRRALRSPTDARRAWTVPQEADLDLRWWSGLPSTRGRTAPFDWRAAGPGHERTSHLVGPGPPPALLGPYGARLRAV
jgi:hypothetical protein